jgi:endonuclease/exonuclease/phosphatase family metal-dependent hydrolase
MSPPRRRLSRPLILLALVLVGVILWSGVVRRGTGSRLSTVPPNPTTAPATAPTTSPTSTPPSTFRVASFNIRSGIGTDNNQDLARTQRTIQQALPLDVLALHEVRGFVLGTSQTQEFARSLQLRGVFAPTEHRWWHDDFGNALLTPHESPILRIPLPQTQERGHRNLTLIRIPLANGQTATIVSTHLDRRDDQPEQVAFVLELFLALQPPAVLMGDLNIPRSDPRLIKLVRHHQTTDALLTNPATSHPSMIELIYTRGLTVRAAGAIDIGASDHPLVWAELVPLNPAPPPTPTPTPTPPSTPPSSP